jgi:WD40 repeat protein
VWDHRAALSAASAPAEGAEAAVGKVEKKRRKMDKATTADAAAAAPPPTLAPAVVLRGHSQPVTGVAWAGGGADSIVSASWDGGVRVWDVGTGKCAHTVGGLKAVQSLALSSGARAAGSGSLLAATGHDNGLVQLWDARAKPGEAAAAKLLSHSRWVSGLAFSDASEHLLLSASHDLTIKMWDVRGKLPLHTLAAHADKVLCVGWGGLDGNTILSGGADSQLLAHALHALN